MPVNPSIPLSVQRPQMLSYLDLRRQQQQGDILDLQEQRERQALKLTDDDAQKRERIRTLFSTGDVSPEALLREGEIELAKGVYAFQQLQKGPQADPKKTAADIARALKVLAGKDPELAERMWPNVRAAAIQGGLGTEESIPQEFTPAYVDAVLAWSGEPTEKPQAMMNLGPQGVFDPNTRQVIEGTASAPTPKPKNLKPEWVLLGGRRVPATFDPDTGRYSFMGKDVTEQVQQLPDKPTQGKEPSYLTLVGPDGKQQRVPDGPQVNTLLAQGWKLHDAVAERQAKPNDPQGARDVTLGALGLAKRLETHPGMGKATGAYELRGFTQEAVDFNAIRDQLVAALALPNLGALKGPMSDKDVLFVKQLATRLANRSISAAETRKAITEAKAFLNGKLQSSQAPTLPDDEGWSDAGGGITFREKK